jgi:predicted PurR-regulated permease PerM
MQSPQCSDVVHLLTYLCTCLLTLLLTYVLTYFLAYLLKYLLSYLLTYLITYLLIYLLTYVLTYFLTYFLTYLLMYVLTYFITYLRTYVLSYLLAYVLTFLLTYLLMYVLTYVLNYLLTYLLTYSVEQSPSWQVERFSARQEILWNPKVHYHIHKSPPPVPILSQLDTEHTPTSHFLQMHLNIILPSTPGSPKWWWCSAFTYENCALLLLRYISYSSIYLLQQEYVPYFYLGAFSRLEQNTDQKKSYYLITD